MMQDHSLRSLATEFNNVGASFHDRGYDEGAEAMYCEALQLMFLISGNSVEISDKDRQRLSDQIAKRKEKLADILTSVSDNDKVAIDDKLLDPHTHQTLMLSDAMRIEDRNSDGVYTDSEMTDVMRSAIILYNYGVIWYKKGCGLEATKLFKTSQELSFQHFGANNLTVITCIAALNNVGHLHLSDGCIDDGLRAFAEAEELAATSFLSVLYETTSQNIDDMEVASRCQGSHNQMIFKNFATILYNKGHAYFSKGEYEAARSSFNEAMKFSRTAHLIRGIAAALNSIGREYQDMGRNRNALNVYRDALKTRRALAKVIDCASLPNVYHITLRNVGSLLCQEGDHNEVLTALKLSVELQYQSYDSLYPEIASTIHSIGVIQLKIGAFAGALKSSKKAASIRRIIFGNENLLVAESLSLLGRIYFESKQYAKAYQAYLEVLHIEETALGSNHAAVAETLCCLGLVSCCRNDLGTSLCMYSRALCITRRSLGLDHPATVQLIHVIGNIHWERGNSQRTAKAAEIAALKHYLDSTTLACGAAAA